MRTYIFLTNSLGGYSGGPSYVRNKKAWLEQHGWEVFAFDSTGSRNTPIDYIEFFEYSGNRIEELYYHPSWFTQRDRERVINQILSKINYQGNCIVIESNIPILAEWGEILAKRLNAKHLVYLIGENVKICDDNEFQFFYHKYIHCELFSISSKAFQSLWGKYLTVEDPDEHYWNAMSHTLPQEIQMGELETINKADFTVTHFGRYKEYIPNVIKELCIFADNNRKKIINVIFFGIKSLFAELKKELEGKSNIQYYLFDSVFPIPKKIFRISDVVIATAGCASISARQNVKTISYNVETNLPIGIMRYNTIQSSYSSSQCADTKQSLHEILDDILIKRQYDYPAPLQLPDYDKGYEYHLSFINSEKIYFDNILSIKYCKTRFQSVQKVLCKLGFVHRASVIRYKRNLER